VFRAPTSGGYRPAVRLPSAVAARLTRAVVAPLLSPRFPLRLRRPLLDATGYLVPVPRGTRRSTGALGGVPTERVVARGAHGPHQVLLVHGGGYQIGSPTSHRAFAAHLSRATGAPVHLPDYRRAPEQPFPAAVDDVEAAYRALRAAGHPSQRIALAGDSAGAGIVMAMLLRLRAAGEELPGSVGLVSPWLDLDLRSPYLRTNARSDAMLSAGWLGPAARAYLASGSRMPAELRPLDADLAGLPPVHVVAGAGEILVGDADTLVERVRAAGGRVTYRRAEGMWHDYALFAGMMADADEAVAELGAALRRDCSGARLPRVAVVGAGFGGIGMGMALRAAGWTEPDDLVIVDRADGVGGVWRANTYPGAACDVPSHLYSFAAAPGHEWSRRFAPQADILRYLQRLTREHGLTGHLHLGTEVTEVRWDEDRAVWRLCLAGGDTLEAEVLVPACGQLSRPAAPPIPGLDRFAGPLFHSAEWDHDVDLSGKRVAVIGTGASAAQFVPAIVDDVAALTVFQRSAPHVIPKPDRPYYARHRAVLRAVPGRRGLARLFWIAFFESGAFGFTSGRGRGVQAAFGLAARTQLRAQVADPALRDRLTPDYPIGCKRVLISSDFYRALTRPHVDVVTERIAEVTATGVRTADGREHRADVVVVATGFETTDFLTPMKVFGPAGRELSEHWREGAHAHLGITVPGFPNLFLIYGPNTNVGSGSMVHMLESQIAYVHQAVRLLAGGLRTLTVRADVESRFDTEVQQRLAGTVWTGCTSWYRTASGRVVNNWPGLMREYRRRTRRLDLSEYEAEQIPTA
jgi:cation diffusion facilitator CzcD-associated flavoprotein CzcO/acetyl esterase/lipase